MLGVEDALVIKELVQQHVARRGVDGLGHMLKQHLIRRCGHTPGATIDMEQL